MFYKIQYHTYNWYETVANILGIPTEKLYKFIEIIYSIVSDNTCFDYKVFDYEFDECVMELYIRYTMTNGEVHQQTFSGKDIVHWMR